MIVCLKPYRIPAELVASSGRTEGYITRVVREENVKWKSAQSANVFHSHSPSSSTSQRQPSNIFHTDVCILNEKFARFRRYTNVWQRWQGTSQHFGLHTHPYTYIYTQLPMLPNWASDFELHMFSAQMCPGRPVSPFCESLDRMGYFQNDHAYLHSFPGSSCTSIDI